MWCFDDVVVVVMIDLVVEDGSAAYEVRDDEIHLRMEESSRLLYIPHLCTRHGCVRKKLKPRD